MKNLSPWRGFSVTPFEGFRQEMEQMMHRFFGEPYRGNGGATLETWAPRVDVEETDKEMLVKADLPGVDPKNVEISVTNDVLALRGERKEQHEEKKKNYHRIERFQGEFYREIPLPAEAETDKVAATSVKGVVTITIPKKAGAQSKKIFVKAQD
jgi:HSP20 family protein